MPVGRPQVSIRLATDGKAQVQRDFADIGDSGDASAKRIAMSYARAANEADASLAKLQKASERMAAVAPISGGPTNAINPVTGGSYAMADGRAQASAAAITQQMAAGEAAAQRLLAAVDPLYAAQMRYDQALAEANTLQRQGLLTSEQYATVSNGLKAQLNDQTMLYGKQGTAVGNTRIAQMELMHVVRGSVDQFAAGAPPMQIFTMHLGMLGQAAALSGESMGKFGAFMSSGWGLALTVAVVALGPLVGKLFESGDAVDGLVGKLKDEAKQQAANDNAHKAFAATLDGVTDALRRNRDALKQQEDQGKSAAEQALKNALAAQAHAAAVRSDTKAQLDNAQATLEAMKVRASGPGQASEVAALGLTRQMDEVTALQSALAKTDADISEAQRQIDQATTAVYAQAAALSPVDLIKARYEGPTGLIKQAQQHAEAVAKAARAAGDEAKAQAAVTTEIAKQVAALHQKESAEIKAAEDRDKKPAKNAGGTAIFDSQIASFFDEAAKFRGKSEVGDKSVLEAFFREANLQLDPEKTAWCAAFVNAVLASKGVAGTGSLAASSFLKFGKDDTHSPQRGDIVVVKSGAGDHVGFLDSIDAKGNVRMLAGNTGNRVAEASYGPGQILGIRRPPTPSEAAAGAETAADKALREQDTFDGERAKLNEQYLRELGKVALGYEAQSVVQTRIAQAEHDAEATQIANNLAVGKYGDSTSKLAQTRAAELQVANDNLLLEKKAAIGLAGYLKSLQDQDAKNERGVQYRVDALQYSESIARTAKARRDLELEIIDIQYDEKKTHLEYLKSLAELAELAGKTDEAAKIQDEINHLPEQKAREQDRSNRANQSPGQAYLDSLPQNIGEVNELLEKDGVEAWKKFNDGLDEALLKSKSLGDFFHNLGSVFHDVAAQILADLLRIAEQEAIMAIFGKQQPQGGQSGGGGGGIFGAIFSGISALFGAGGSGGGSGLYATLTSADIPAFPAGGMATGTEYFSGGATWVGEHGPELVRLPRGSKISTAADSRRMAAANDGGPRINVVNHNDFRGADPSAVAMITARIDQMEQDLPKQVITTWQDARQRFVLR